MRRIYIHLHQQYQNKQYQTASSSWKCVHIWINIFKYHYSPPLPLYVRLCVFFVDISLSAVSSFQIMLSSEIDSIWTMFCFILYADFVVNFFVLLLLLVSLSISIIVTMMIFRSIWMEKGTKWNASALSGTWIVVGAYVFVWVCSYSACQYIYKFVCVNIIFLASCNHIYLLLL